MAIGEGSGSVPNRMLVSCFLAPHEMILRIRQPSADLVIKCATHIGLFISLVEAAGAVDQVSFAEAAVEARFASRCDRALA